MYFPRSAALSSRHTNLNNARPNLCMSHDPERQRLTTLLERIKLLHEWLARCDEEPDEVKQLLLRQREEAYTEAKRLLAQGIQPLAEEARDPENVARH